MATYPSGIYSPTTLTDGVDDVLASHQNTPNAEIVAIETAIGINPTTIDDTVGSTASPASVAAYLDMVANIVKTISGSTTWVNAAAAAVMKSIGTAKGDLISFTGSATPARHAVGSNGQIIIADSTQSDGWKWGDAPSINDSVVNGKLSPTVSSNNLTLALKTLAGNDPSTSDIVYATINGTRRSITSALSVTVNAGANSYNAGSAELATKEIDFFPYLSYVSTSSAVAIGYARFPYARLYSDFSTVSTNEKYISFSTAPASTDHVIEFGRFAATLSTSTAYNWSVPTYTPNNLIHKPINETRWLNWSPVWLTSNLGGTTGTFSSVTVTVAKYRLIGSAGAGKCEFEIYALGTLGGSACPYVTATVPFEATWSSAAIVVGPMLFADGSATPGAFGGIFVYGGTPDILCFNKYNNTNWHTSGGANVDGNGFYEI